MTTTTTTATTARRAKSLMATTRTGNLHVYHLIAPLFKLRTCGLTFSVALSSWHPRAAIWNSEIANFANIDQRTPCSDSPGN